MPGSGFEKLEQIEPVGQPGTVRTKRPDFNSRRVWVSIAVHACAQPVSISQVHSVILTSCHAPELHLPRRQKGPF